MQNNLRISNICEKFKKTKKSKIFRKTGVTNRGRTLLNYDFEAEDYVLQYKNIVCCTVISRQGSTNVLFNTLNQMEPIVYDVIENAGGVPYQLIFGNMPGNGFYSHIGAGIKEMLGIEPEKFDENAFNSMIRKIILPDKNIPMDLEGLRGKLINGEITGYKAEVLVVTGNGEKKWIRDSSIPLKDEYTGKIIGSSGILFDITGNNRNLPADDELNGENENLKSSFLRNISHEVRTPLNAIVGFSTLLCEPEHEYEKKKEFANLLNISTDHLLEIMDNILEISKIETDTINLSCNETSPAMLLERIYHRYIGQATSKGLSLNMIIPEEGETKIQTDSYKLFQIMNNLVSNAIKFTLTGNVDFGYRFAGRNLEFFVNDTGIGIREEHKKKVFDKFFQADSGNNRRFPGTGLGLSISAAYARMLKATIDFTSVFGSGSVFRLILPIRGSFRTGFE